MESIYEAAFTDRERQKRVCRDNPGTCGLKAGRGASGREERGGEPPGPSLAALPCPGDFQFSKSRGHPVSVFSFPSHREECYSL